MEHPGLIALRCRACGRRRALHNLDVAVVEGRTDGVTWRQRVHHCAGQADCARKARQDVLDAHQPEQP